MHRIVRGCALMICGVLPVGIGRAQGRTADQGRVLEANELAAAFPGLRKTITVRFEGKPIEQALREIAVKADLALTYSDLTLPKRHMVWLTADRIRADKALEKVLADAGLALLPLSNGQLVVVPSGHDVGRQTGSIVGRVLDAKTNQPVVDAEVLLANARQHRTTDTAGRYQFKEVETGNYTLVVRRFGYAKQSRPVTVRDGQTDTVDVTLTPAAVTLNELITTATGQQRRRDIGNAITTIHADSVLQSAPIRNLTDLLENRVPGLTVQHTSGAPGDPARLRLRGIGSVLRSNDPVVILDGVRVYAAESEARSGNLTNFDPSKTSDGMPRRIYPVDVPAPSPLDQIDPNIIDKIEVFKGPSAATLYGADAANGVIVITTKRGRPGPTLWEASVTHGWTTSPGQYPTGYYRWGHLLSNNVPEFCTLIDVTCAQDSLVQFQALNIPALTVLGQGRRTALSLTASGGTQALTYGITGSYGTETGLLTLPEFEVDRFRTLFNHEPPDWMRRPHQLEDWSVRSNITARLGSSAEVALSTSLSRSEQQRTSLERQLAPLAGTYIDTVNGIYYRPSTVNDYALSATSAILSDYYVRQTASAITFTTGLNATWRPRPWFSAIGQAGLNVIPRDDQLLLPAGLVSATDSGSVVRGTGRSLESTLNLQGTVRKPLGLGFMFETSVGANVTTTSTGDLVSSASGLVPGTSGLAGAARTSATESRTNISVFGWYIEPRLAGRRLALSTGIRLDGGSAYGARVTKTGSGGVFGGLLSLPKLNGTWVVSEEPWFPFHTLFSSLRFRGAYGQAQVQPGAADHLRLYTRSADQDGAKLKLTQLGNTALRPERSTEFEGGFDAELLDSRLVAEVTGYRKLQVDALMSVQLPGSVNGGGTVLTNVGNIKNTGYELRLVLTPLRRAMLTASLELNTAHNDNTLVKLGNGVASNPVLGLVAGYPVGGRWARPIIGYADQNGDGVLQPGEIQVGDSSIFMGRLQPNNTTTLFTNVELFNHAVGVTAGFSYISGATQVDSTAHTNWVLARALVDHTVPLSEQAAVWASTRLTNPTDYGLTQEISTFRFSSLSVNYHAPPRVAQLLRARQLSFAVQGSNLGLHSTYHGKDPDVSAWSPGENIVDTGQLPQPRTWQLAVFLQY